MTWGVNRRRWSAAVLSGLLLSGGLAGCDHPPLRLGLHPWPGYEPLVLADGFGWLPDGVTLNWGTAASDTLDGLRTGRLDAGALTLDEVLQARSQGLPLVVVAVVDESVGADQVLARAATHPNGWRGARVAFEPSAVGHLVLKLWLESVGLTVAEVRAMHLSPAQQSEAWAAGVVDVAISYPPHALTLREQGAVVLYDSSHFPGLVLDVLAVHRDRLGWRDSTRVADLVAAHFRGLEHLRVNPEDALRRIARAHQTTYADTLASFGGLNLPQVTVNRALLREGGDLGPVAARLAAVMVEARLLPAVPDLSDLTTDRYLPRS